MAKEYFINKVLATTVVGSYPVVKGGGLKSLFDPFHSAVETAVADQIKAGIDIISDGQVRGDMIGAFTAKLPGIREQQVIGKVQPADGQGGFAKYVVLASGPKTELVKQLGLKADDKGYLPSDRNGRTNVERVYVAGWASRADKVQAIISAGDGAAVALDILSVEKGKDFHDFDSAEDEADR